MAKIQRLLILTIQFATVPLAAALGAQFNTTSSLAQGHLKTEISSNAPLSPPPISSSSSSPCVEPISSSSSSSSSCTSEPTFFCAVDGEYDYVGNNCHDHANVFAQLYPGSRVLMCDGRHAGSFSGHSVNVAPNPTGGQGEWCVVEPQNGVSCCFSQPTSQDTCGNVNIDFSESTAQACYQKICGDQATVVPSPRCQLMPEEFKAKTHDAAFGACANESNRDTCYNCCERVHNEAREHLRAWTNSTLWDCFVGNNSEYEEQIRLLDEKYIACRENCKSKDRCVIEPFLGGF